MANESPNELSDVFVSYRRTHIEFAKQLVESLKAAGKSVWVDWEDIPPGSKDFPRDIKRGLEGADAFICVLTPSYLESRYCVDMELNYAVQLNKKLIPIVVEKFEDQPPDGIKNINWTYFVPHMKQANDYDSAFKTVIKILVEDPEHANYHTNLARQAIKWSENARKAEFLVGGQELEQAENWLINAGNKIPLPTDLQREFVVASRKRATQNWQTRTGVLGLIIFLLGAIVVYLGFPPLREQFWAKPQALGEMVRIDAEGIAPESTATPSPELLELPFPENMPESSFLIDKYEVSNRQYRFCVDYGNCTVPLEQADFRNPDKQDYPVVFVTLFQANNFCQWLGMRLPRTEEWELAARGYNGNLWPWGSNPPLVPFINMPDGRKNKLILHDIYSFADAATLDTEIYNMVGNVWEWTSSYYYAVEGETASYWDGLAEDFRGTVHYRTRGGGFANATEDIQQANPNTGTDVRDDLGFRCSADAK